MKIDEGMLSTGHEVPLFHTIADEESYLLVDKLPGISVHRDKAALSLLEAIRASTGYPYLAPVHRLDKATSGLWLLAKNPDAAADLSAQFATRRVEKYYLALSRGKPRKKQGTVAGALVKTRGGSYRLAREGEPWSVTQFFSVGLGGGQRLFLLKPLTGRTHQLRVVMRSLGAPIMGDQRYGKREAQEVDDDRCYLHAFAIGFSVNGERVRYTRQPQTGRHFLAGDCREQIAKLAEPWTLSWPRIKSQGLIGSSKHECF